MKYFVIVLVLIGFTSTVFTLEFVFGENLDDEFQNAVKRCTEQSKVFSYGTVIQNSTHYFDDSISCLIFDNRMIKGSDDVSAEKRVYENLPDFIKPPLKQFKSGIPVDEIQCNKPLTLVTKNDGFPACVKEQTLLKLVERKLIITSIAERDLMLDAGYKLYPGAGWVKNAQENTITPEPPSEYPNSCPPWKFYNETEKTCNVVLPCPDNMFFSDVSQECEFSRTSPPEPESEKTSDEEMQLYDARKSLQNAYQNHLNLGPYYMKDVVVGFGTYDDTLIVDIASKYTDSNSFQTVKKEIQHIVGNDVSVDYVVYDEPIERHIETVIPYLWNKILHQKNIDFAPKEMSYFNNADGFRQHDRVCSPLVALNGTEFFISSTFNLEPFEIIGTSIDKTQPDDCHKIWKTDVLMTEPDRVTTLWLENEN